MIPTAEQIVNKYALDDGDLLHDAAIIAMIEFAKLHVKAALEAASEKARIINDPNSYCGNTGSEYPPDQIVSKYSILNAYPDELVK